VAFGFFPDFHIPVCIDFFADVWVISFLLFISSRIPQGHRFCSFIPQTQ
jgi:hypothetical protein